MAPTPTKAEEILNSAERLARRRGYNGFSFRDLAEEVGIKSASVHYHFPTKANLGAAVAQRYTERFIAGLGDPDDPGAGPRALLERYVDAFRRALVRDRQMCLCGMLGAEVESLPPEVASEVRTFFELNVEWLAAVLSRRAGGAPGNGVPEDGVPEDGVPEDGVPEDGVPEDGVLEDGVPGDRTMAERQALTILAMLEGALVVARTMRRDEVFDRIAEAVTALAPPDR
jgi:TetR/AcrR family transcriptional repressor of nem operon